MIATIQNQAPKGGEIVHTAHVTFFMKKSLRTLGLAALVAGASLFGAKKADANVLLKIGPVDSNNNFVTNVFLNQPFRIGVYLDSTGEPTKNINSIDWDVFFGSLTNYVALNGAQLPSSTEDFFQGYTPYPGWNRVDGTLGTTGYADDNVRMVTPGTDRKSVV